MDSRNTTFSCSYLTWWQKYAFRDIHMSNKRLAPAKIKCKTWNCHASFKHFILLFCYHSYQRFCHTNEANGSFSNLLTHKPRLHAALSKWSFARRFSCDKSHYGLRVLANGILTSFVYAALSHGPVPAPCSIFLYAKMLSDFIVFLESFQVHWPGPITQWTCVFCILSKTSKSSSDRGY